MPGTNAMVLEKVALSLRYKAVCPLAALLLLKQLFAQQSHHRVQRQNDRRAALSGFVGPLVLRLQAKVGTRFLKRHLDLPALGKPAQYLDWRGVLVRTQECLGFKLLQRITRH